MTRKQGNKTQTEAGGTGVVSSESSDSFPGTPGTLRLQKSGGQKNSDSSPTIQSHIIPPFFFVFIET